MENVTLHKVIDTEVLQKILDRFGEATGLAAITVDYRGKPITQYSNFSDFCKLLREDQQCRDRCHQCDAYGGLEAARKEEPYIYRCHAGLVDFAIPIIFNGQMLGSIMAGQARVKEDELDQLEFITKETVSWRENEAIVKAFEAIPVITYEKVAASAQMLFLVANHIVEKNVMRFIQEELNQKNTRLIEQMKVQAELENQLKDIEMKALLQLQINPHFLFNVLNTASRLAIIESAPKTQDMIFTLSEIMKYVLQYINELVRLEQELVHLERYLKIQIARFGDRFQYSQRIPDDLKSVKLPSMILQAIVDNAIIHGLEPKEGKGTLQLSMYAMEEDVIIEIKDDGVGISPERLEQIFQVDKQMIPAEKNKGIGLRVVNMMLVYHFGQEYKLQIASKPNGGTTVQIRLPKQSRGVSHV